MHRTVTLVDEQDHPLGQAEIVAAHTGEGQLHRAFSVYVFRKNGQEVLIQQRSAKKMLWPGIWANTCCSHPLENESATQAGERRLQEELGFSVALEPKETFVYRALDPEGRGVEHEHVTILLGTGDDATVEANADEVMDWKWMDIDALRHDMMDHADLYAPWFHRGLALLLKKTH